MHPIAPLLASLLTTQIPATPKPATAPNNTPLQERDRITGDWWGHRTALEARGLSINAEYTAEYSAVLSGGISRQASFRNLFTLDAELDLETAFALQGATAFIQYLSVNPETGGSADAGDLQVYSNIENDKHLDVIYELWYEQRFLDDRLRIKLGKVDANSEFAFVDAAGDFANASAGFSPTIFPFPSYPDPAMSVNVFATVIDASDHTLTLGYGFYDGAAADGVPTGRQGPASFFSSDRSDAHFHIWQLELAWTDLAASTDWLKDGRLSAGIWHHDAAFERLDGTTESGSTGFYLTVEQRIHASDEDDQGLYAFAQLAAAQQSHSEVKAHYAAGLVLRGITDARPSDAAGIYASLADLSDDPAADFDGDELAIDLYYRIQITPAVYVQPELQYIVNPSGDPTIDDALVGGLRAGIAF